MASELHTDMTHGVRKPLSVSPDLSFSVLALHCSVPHLWDVCALAVFVDRVLLRIAQTGLEFNIAQDRLKLAMILLPWPPKCWDYTHDAQIIVEFYSFGLVWFSLFLRQDITFGIALNS